METIKVNMNPNPLDVQTIHASQNDGEARQWGFELHNNGELIDTSDVKEQLFFKAYKGGTEQILPENTSTPTTSPFNGDIKYPQGLLSDQEFLYRESPTEEDGLAKITDIKGNTIVWNQVVQNGNFADSSLWAGQSTTISISNNIANVTLSAKGTFVALRQSVFASVTGHKYLVTATFKCTKKTAVGFYLNGQGAYLDGYDIQANTLTKVSALINGGESGGFNIYVSRKNELDVGDVVQVSNVMLFDLTQMGLDISNPSDFTSLFPLPYYSYNQGTLLSFMGNGIKTVGKNLASGISQGAVDIHGGTTSNEKRLRVDGFVRVFQGDHYTFTATSNSGKTLQIYTRYFADANGNEQVSYLDWLNLPRSVIIPSGVNYATFTIRFGNNDNITLNDISDVQVEHGTSATSYEPYTSSTLSLPISTYFPNGMKSAGSVYDELTPTKAITRVGMVDLGSLPLFYYTPPTSDKPIAQFFANLPNALSGVNTNVRCALYTASSSPVYGRDVDKTVCTFNGRVYICDSAYTDATAFKTAMDGVYLYYELATSTETSFTTASLVTENAEIPLSNEDGTLIGKCTEELSAEPGFHDAKIKLSDSDGECYSNKIQLHVERSPQ